MQYPKSAVYSVLLLLLTANACSEDGDKDNINPTPTVVIETSMGEIIVELDSINAPVAVE